MKILKQETPDCRIVQMRSLWYSFFNVIIARQRKKWWGWKVSSWLYSGQSKTVEEYKTWFDWDENKVVIGKTQFK